MMQPLMAGIDNKKIKNWFQNRRAREKQKKGSGEIVSGSENLDNRVVSFASNPSTSNPSTSYLASEPGDVSPHLFSTIPDSNQRLLLSLAEEAKNEFLSKVIGTAIEWIPIPSLKLPNPSSAGAIYVAYSCTGVAAQACTIVPFDPLKTIEILNDRPSWCRDCRSIEITASYPGINGKNIDIIHTKFYASTTLTCARDFWTLRYTSVLDDGSFVVCEKSVSASDVFDLPISPYEPDYVEGNMLASGYLIRPCEGGSTVYLVGHFDFQAASVPEVVKPLYVSSELMAEKMIVPALYHIEHLANEMTNKSPYPRGNTPAFVRRLSKKLIRGFNDAINGFTEDAWSLMSGGALDNLIISVKQIDDGIYDNVICVKTTLILQNITPSRLVKLLRERRLSWMDFTFPDNPTTFSRAASLAYPPSNTHYLSEKPVKLGHTDYRDEVLEELRFRRLPRDQFYSKELNHLQICNGIEDSSINACSELIFAPVYETTPDHAVLLCSGFRILSLGSNETTWSSTNSSSSSNNGPRSMLVVAFQFPLENNFQEDAVVLAKQYVRHIMSSVNKITYDCSPQSAPKFVPEHALTPAPALSAPDVYGEGASGLVGGGSHLDSTVQHIHDMGEMQFGTNPSVIDSYENIETGPMVDLEPTYSFDFAYSICQSYRFRVGWDIPGFNCENTNASVLIQNHPLAIMCFSLQSPGFCIFWNQSALNMVETTPENMQSLTVDQILTGTNGMSLYSILSTTMLEGRCSLQSGCFQSFMTNLVTYEAGAVWKVKNPFDSLPYLAIALFSWLVSS